MMRRALLLFILATAIQLGAVRPARAQDSNLVFLSGRYASGIRPGLWVLSGPGLDSVRAIIDRDLQQSDRFEMSLPDSAARLTGPFNSALLKGSKLAWVVELQPAGTDVEVRLHEISSGTVKQNGRYPVDRRGAGDARMAIHRISDSIVKWTTGGIGIAATRVLYVQDPRGDASAGLYRMDIDGQNRVKIPTNGWAVGPTWAPNGQYIAYAEYNAESIATIVIRTLATGNRILLRKQNEHARDSYLDPAFSPDMKRLLFARSGATGYGDIYSADISNLSGSCCIEALTVVDRRIMAINVKPAYSPDGRMVVFESERSGRTEIYRMDADGSAPEAVPGASGTGAKFHAPAWSPDGSKLAFEQEDGSQRPQIWVLELASGRMTQITSVGRNAQVSWAPDSRHLLFRSNRDGGRDRLYVWDLETKTGRQLATPGGNARYPSWSPILSGTNP